jgi:adenylate cyclase, class 2
MSYEVEQKYRIDDTAELIEGVAELGGSFEAAELQVDTYYAHPARDFAQTDEALRIRRDGDEAFITYKGPKIDADSKTRREIELPLTGGVGGAVEHAELLEALGFRAVANVSKQRRNASIVWQKHAIEVSLDEVDRVGAFVEIETAADDVGLDEAKQCLASLAQKLGLASGERRSYLELLLSADASVA